MYQGGDDSPFDDANKEIPFFTWTKVLKFIHSPSLFILNIILCCITGSCPFIFSYFQGYLADLLSTTPFITSVDFYSSIASYTFTFSIFTLSTFLLSSLRDFFFYLITPRLRTDLESSLFKAILSQPISFFNEHNTGLLLARLTGDAIIAFQAIDYQLWQLINSLSPFFFGIFSLLSIDVFGGLICIFMVLLNGLSTSIGQTRTQKGFVEYCRRSSHVKKLEEEVLTQMRTIRSFDSEARQYRVYKEALADQQQTILDLSLLFSFQDFFSELSMLSLVSLLLFVFGKRLTKGLSHSGSLVALVNNIDFLGQPMSIILQTYNEFKRYNVAVSKVFEIIDLKPPEDGVLDLKATGKIELKEVSFSYGNELILDDLNLTINPGETVAIVGESGCGKSTLLSLIMRLQNPSKGIIELDGINIKTLSRKSLSDNIAFVPQEPVIFSMSVKENIKYGNQMAQRIDVRRAASRAKCDFIEDLELSFGTPINQNTLSGGQKQRLCIARAILVDSPIIVLDEATSALDMENEAFVHKAFAQLGLTKTLIIVAHRLSTVSIASRILVLDGGHIVEQGTHEHLLSLNGFYKRLVDSQLLYSSRKRLSK